MLNTKVTFNDPQSITFVVIIHFMKNLYLHNLSIPMQFGLELDLEFIQKKDIYEKFISSHKTDL